MLVIAPLRKSRAAIGRDGDECEDQGVLGKALALLERMIIDDLLMRAASDQRMTYLPSGRSERH